METTRQSRPLAVLAAALVLGGCATPFGRDEAAGGPDESDDGSVAHDGAVTHAVQRGDRLGDIAREYTGDVLLWTRIAEHNGIDDPRTLREGAVLEIPASLLSGVPARSGESGTTTPVASSAASRDAGTGDAEGRAEPVELSPVVVNRRFVLSPIDGGTARSTSVTAQAPRVASTSPVPTPTPPRVRVIGSYFPKGVYAQPATYSKLMMRVAPGTLFELDREVRGWYGVVTEQGIGYLREGDGQLLSTEDADRG